jgi:hypothetical protein
LFLMPFCVSSFSALVKGRGFVLIFSPNPVEILAAVALCAILIGVVLLLRKLQRRCEAVEQALSGPTVTTLAENCRDR